MSNSNNKTSDLQPFAGVADRVETGNWQKDSSADGMKISEAEYNQLAALFEKGQRHYCEARRCEFAIDRLLGTPYGSHVTTALKKEDGSLNKALYAEGVIYG